ncbi:MAG: hypothetical protein NVSMB26_10510 [Beijerinckiaceae bacterium]
MSARLLEDFAEISCDWFWEMDENLRFSYFSYRWSALFGRSPEQEIGKSRLDVAMNADDKVFWQPHIDDLLARRAFRDLIYPYRFADGHIRWLKVSGQPVIDSQGVFAGYRGVGTDITEEYRAKRRLSETLEELRHTNRAYTLVNAELQRQNARLIEQERELSAQATRLAATLDNMHQGLLMLDADLNTTVFNAKFAQLLGFSSGIVREGVTARELLAEAFRLGHYLGRDFDEMYARWLRRLAKREASVHRQLLADGRVLSVAYVPMADAGWVVTYEDVTERERADTAIRKQRHQLDAALNNMAQGLCMFDDQHRVIVYNQRYIEIFRFSPQFVRPGVTLRELLEHNVEVGNLSGPTEQLYQQYVSELKQHGSLSLQRDHLDGRTIAISHRPMADGGWVATYEDITEQKLAEAKILQLARQDALTKLPNRILFGEKMNEALARVRRGEKVAVLCLDLDHFKMVNDTLGHSAGDALLRIVAERLQECVRETDTVARLGGDEFAVLLVGVEQPEEISIVASRVIECIGAPYDLEGHHVVIGTSIGASSAPQDAEDAETMLKNADMALYRAKEDGRGVCRFFVPAMDAHIQRQRKLELDLRRALEEGEFELFYQPLVDVRSGEITGFEALLRWCDRERGIVDPSDFIPLAEEIGVIVRLGEWAIRTACADASAWPKHLKVAVNLSPAQFRSKTLTHTVVSALGASGLAPNRLELEITESVLLQKSDETLATLHQLRGLGVRIVMDDFGTGYSSLNYLRSFPFDRIKIDRAFVQDLGQKADCIAILTAIAGLGTSLGIATTAEGVETAEQLRAVRDLGYTEAQGFLFGAPRPANHVAALIAGGTIKAA